MMTRAKTGTRQRACLRPHVVLVRHGHDCRENPDQEEPALSSLGRAQAHALALQLSKYHFDALYTSPRPRARETAAILGKRLGLEPVSCDALRQVRANPAGFMDLLQVVAFARHLDPEQDALIVTHAGTLRYLLVALMGWRQFPWFWRRVPYCQPFICPEAPAPGLTAPLLLFLIGIALGLFSTHGELPGFATLASYGAAFALYWLAARSVERGFVQVGLILLVIVPLALAPLAFAPSPLNNRKVTAFNAWAFALGSHVPPLLPTPPHPNGVAGALAVALGITLAAALWNRGWRRGLAWLGTLLAIGSLAVTASRAGWLAGIGAAAFVVAQRNRTWTIRPLAIAGVLLLFLFLFAGQPPAGSPALVSTASLTMRAEEWNETVVLLREHPILGLGVAQFPEAYARAVAGTGRRAYKTPNNTLLETWSDAGILGLLAFVWLVARARAILKRAHRQTELVQWRVVALSAALIALGIHGIFESNTVLVWASGNAYHHLASPLPYLILGLLAGWVKSQQEPGTTACGRG